MSPKELVFLMPPAPVLKGYFEVSSSLGTKILRTGRSREFEMELGTNPGMDTGFLEPPLLQRS